MNHYEIVLIFHPNFRDQIEPIVQRYIEIIQTATGKIHRQENWGLRNLAYPIKKQTRAFYNLLNIECSADTLNELTSLFRYNDAVLRSLILRKEAAVTEESVMLKKAPLVEEPIPNTHSF